MERVRQASAIELADERDYLERLERDHEADGLAGVRLLGRRGPQPCRHSRRRKVARGSITW
jgi:hypothetical protein